MELAARRDAVVADQRQTYTVDSDRDEAHTLRPLQAAAVQSPSIHALSTSSLDRTS